MFKAMLLPLRITQIDDEQAAVGLSALNARVHVFEV
jgi:hypothetical protein